jgi:prepilin-type N-terminal cleavage/methylation domain-containing protein
MTGRSDGMTLVEVAVVAALIGVMAALGAPALEQWFANQRVRAAARSVGDAFLVARADAIRTGRAHVVYLSAAPAGNPPATDPAGTALGLDPATGGPPPVVETDDGPLATANCLIDAGELRRQVRAERGVAWGIAASGGAQAPGDGGAGNPADGATFTDTAGNAVTWVMFRPDGLPVTFDAGCNRGLVGGGGGAVYVTNGARDYAVVLTPLGGVRLHAWDERSGAWTN